MDLMIHFLLRRSFEYTVDEFLAHQGSRIAERCRILTYEDAFCATDFTCGLFIFTDMERLADNERRLALRLYDRLADQPDVTLLNHPTRTLLRYDLLRRLEERGINNFKVSRIDPAGLGELTFPVFLRREDNHSGPITPLISSSKELAAQIIRLRLNGYDLNKVIAIEYLETVDAAGVYTKYGAYIVRDRVLPRHVRFGRDWMVKGEGQPDSRHLAQEMAYIDENPHVEIIKTIADDAGIGYGRIDYSMVGGRMQVWEINTNPHIETASRKKDPSVQGVRTKRENEFFSALSDLLVGLDASADRTFSIEAVSSTPIPRPRVPLDKVERSRLQARFARLPYETQMRSARLLRLLGGRA
jgi:hypothetical protein